MKHSQSFSDKKTFCSCFIYLCEPKSSIIWCQFKMQTFWCFCTSIRVQNLLPCHFYKKREKFQIHLNITQVCKKVTRRSFFYKMVLFFTLTNLVKLKFCCIHSKSTISLHHHFSINKIWCSYVKTSLWSFTAIIAMKKNNKYDSAPD